MPAEQHASYSPPARLWTALSALTAGLLFLMLSHQSDSPIVLGRYSLTYAFQLGFILDLIGLFAGLAVL